MIAQLDRRDLTPSARQLVEKSGLEHPTHYVRRSVYIAGIEAWNRASAWQTNKCEIRDQLKAQSETVERIRQDARQLGAWSRAIMDRKHLKIADPTVVRRSSRDELIAERLDRAACLIELLDEDFDFLLSHWASIDIGRREPLTDFFLENLANLWRSLFGKMPPVSRLGSFVEFADATWDLLGWASFYKRDGLGKAILEKATAENWSRSTRSLSRLAGTRTAE